MSGLDENENTIIHLISTDDIKFSLPKKYVSISNILNTSLSFEDFKQEIDEKGDILLHVELESNILSKIVQYMDLRKGEEIILNTKKTKEEISEYNSPNTFTCKKNFETCFGIPKQEADFMRTFYRNRKMLYEVCEAANYLHIESLLHICCAIISCLMKGKKIEELKIIMDRTYIVPDNVDEEI